MSKILIGDRDKRFADAIQSCLALEHHVTRVETNGWRIQECLSNDQYDVIILDAKLPGVDCINMIRQFRGAGGGTPIILLSSMHNSDELEIGLDAGADDYIVKPIMVGDLAAKIRASLRRPTLSHQPILRSGNIAMNVLAGSVTRDNVPIHLHPMEFKLLQFFLQHPNQVFDANALSHRVWNKDGLELGNDTVRTHIRTLRKKVDISENRSIVTTVRGHGYKSENHPVCIKAQTAKQLQVA